MSPDAWALGLLAALAVGMAKGGLSMVGMLGVPLMTLVMSPVQAAGILLPIYIISDLGGLIAFRRSFDVRVIATLLPGAAAGIALGWAIAARVDEAAVVLIVGLIGCGFAMNAILRPRPDASPHPPRWGRGSLWGALSGYTSFVAHAGAPPYQVYVQPMRMPPMVYAGTTTIYFALVNAMKLIPYAALGQLSPANLRLSAGLAPAAVLGVVAGLWLVRRIPQALFYRLITWALLIVSLRLIWQGLAG